MSNINNILNLKNIFNGRLPDDILDDAIAYVEYNESALAIETLCDQLIEYDVKITEGEYWQLLDIAKEFSVDLSYPAFKHLKGLIH